MRAPCLEGLEASSTQVREHHALKHLLDHLFIGVVAIDSPGKSYEGERKPLALFILFMSGTEVHMHPCGSFGRQWQSEHNLCFTPNLARALSSTACYHYWATYVNLEPMLPQSNAAWLLDHFHETVCKHMPQRILVQYRSLLMSTTRTTRCAMIQVE